MHRSNKKPKPPDRSPSENDAHTKNFIGLRTLESQVAPIRAKPEINVPEVNLSFANSKLSNKQLDRISATAASEPGEQQAPTEWLSEYCQDKRGRAICWTVLCWQCASTYV